MAVRFCEIGWLNVSVKLCVFCSSVLFCEKKNIGELSWEVLSLTKDIFFSHRAHRVHGGFWRTFRAHRTPPAYRVHRGLSAIIITNKGHNEAYILFIGVSRWLLPFPSGEGPGEGPLSFWPLCVLFFCVLCEKKYVILYLSLCHSV